MKLLKQAIRKILSAFGYQLVRFTNSSVNYDNFSNLAQAYEHRLNDLDNGSTPPNKMRPQLLARLVGTPPCEAYFIVQALEKCKGISGDVCEFGVAQGETSALIANEILLSKAKTLHLFDSFEGLPKPSEKDKLKNDVFSLGSMDAYAGTMSYLEEMVQSRLKAISFPSKRYAVHKGFIEQLIHTDANLPEEVCFAYVDLDFYEPTKIALEFLHRVTPAGAVIIVDDYDFFSTGVKTAVDEWLAETNSGETVYECFVPDAWYGRFAVLTKKA